MHVIDYKIDEKGETDAKKKATQARILQKEI